MAEESEGGSGAMNNVWFLVGGLFILTVLWIVQGGARGADLRGIFLHPPAPVGSGGAYGPQIATSTTYSTDYAQVQATITH